MTSKQVDLTKNFFALGLMFWLYERSHGADARAGSTTKFGAKPVIAEANTRALKAGYAFGETTEMFHTHYRVRAGPARRRARTATSPATRRRRSASSPPSQAGQARPVLRLVPDHAGQRHPPPALDATRTSASRRSRPRTRSRRSARPSARRYGGALGLTATLRPGHRAQERGDGPRGDGRAAARRRRRPARRPSHRHAHQDRAGGPAPGHVRPQRRLADPDRRAGHARPSASTTPSRRGASRSST